MHYFMPYVSLFILSILGAMKIFRWEAGSFMILPLSFVTFVQMLPVTVITIYNQGVLGKRGQNEHFKPSLPRSTYMANRITSVHSAREADNRSQS